MEPTIRIRPEEVVDLLLDAVCVVDADARILYISAACERIFGYTPQEMIGRVILEMLHPDDLPRTLGQVGRIMSGELQTNFENRYLRKDGQVVHIMWTARWSEAGQFRVAVARDISERKCSETRQQALYAISEAAHSADDLVSLFQRIHQIVGELLPARNFFVALYDAHDDLLSFPFHVDERDPAPAPRGLDASTLSATVIRSAQTLLLTPETPADVMPERAGVVDGRHSLYWLGVPLNSRKGTVGALAVQSYSETTRYSEKDQELLQFVSTQVAAAIERKQMHARLRHIALYDHLTQLPNRELLHDRLGIALERARREQEKLSLLYLDLDNFKQVNDTLGHAGGDLLLRQVAGRLQECVRACDTVARIGGDEFVVLLEHIRVPEDASAVARAILDALNRPFDVHGHSVSVLPSVGIAVFPEHGEDEHQLLDRADEAMYAAKKRGGNQLQLVDAPLDGKQMSASHAAPDRSSVPRR